MWATLSVMKEIAIIGMGTHVISTFIAAGMGWGNPFSDRADSAALQRFTVSFVAVVSFLGTLVTCPLVPLLMRKVNARGGSSGNPREHRTTAIAKNAWIVMRQSVGTLVLSLVASGVSTTLLFWAGVPVVRYNVHSLFACVTVNICAVSMASNYRRFCRNQPKNSIGSRRLSAVNPVSVTVSHVERSRPRRRRFSWKQSISRAVRISVPSLVAAMFAIQYITISRSMPFKSAKEFVIFAVASSLLKALVPVAVKYYIAKNSIHDRRNAFFMISAPLFHIEIQLRMAMLKAQTSMPLFVSSGVVSVVELVTRAAAVAFDLVIVYFAEKRLKKKKQELTEYYGGDDNSDIRAQLLLLDDNHSKWKKSRLRLCAAEAIAGMAAEYCGIGLTTLFVLVLDGNASIDLSRPPISSMDSLVPFQLRSWATQIGFEMATDVVATAVEIHVGIPVLDVIKNDADGFIRWTIAIVATQSSGVCLSSFIVAQ